MKEYVTEILRLYVGAVIITAFVCSIYILAVFEIPEANDDTVNILVGALSGIAGCVASHFFGSSLGSKEKNNTLSEIAKGKVNGGQ